LFLRRCGSRPTGEKEIERCIGNVVWVLRLEKHSISITPDITGWEEEKKGWTASIDTQPQFSYVRTVMYRLPTSKPVKRRFEASSQSVS
jgi:hypothetical protein